MSGGGLSWVRLSGFIDVTYENAGQLVRAGWVCEACAVQRLGDGCTCFRSLSAEGQETLLSLPLQSSQSG